MAAGQNDPVAPATRAAGLAVVFLDQSRRPGESWNHRGSIVTAPDISHNSPRRSSIGLAWRWGLLAFVVTLAVATVGACLWLRDPAPHLTRQAFDQARQRWESAQIADYDVEVEVQGRQPAVYRVEVRNNVVRSALRNGYPLKQRRTHATWTVPGMFDTIEIDLESVERATASEASGQRPASQLQLRARFHEKYGYPAYYHRGEYGGQDVVWRVRRFVVVGRDRQAVGAAAQRPAGADAKGASLAPQYLVHGGGLCFLYRLFAVRRLGRPPHGDA